MATLSAQITPTGITAPDYSDIYAQLQNAFYQIYGSDSNLEPDSQDGQWIAILASAIYDNNMLAVAVYNAYSPTTAQGAGLSSVVKINGIRRKVPTDSTAVVSCGGVYGTVVVGGLVGDNLNLGTQWALDTFTIPIGGTIDVATTCTTEGAVSAAPGTLTNILTPTLGWQSATNADSATLGAPVEDDAELRQRQSLSTSLPALTPLESIYAAIANVPGVGRLQVYQNDTDSTNGDGIPAHSISAVVEGGDPVAICTAIAATKSPGTGTYGSTSEVIIDSNGVPNTINFYVLEEIIITADITVQPLTGWVSSTTTPIATAVQAWLAGLGIGENDYLNRLFAPANLSGDTATTALGQTQSQLDALSTTYNVTSITQAIGSGAQEAADIAIAFNQAASPNSVVNVTAS
jgi:uncharacterized phage protein gp47/JayE